MFRRTKLLLAIFSLAFLINAAEAKAQSGNGRLYFDPTSTEVEIGAEFATAIHVDTAGSKSGGVGAILKYNPVFLEVVSVRSGIIFDDYPLAAINNESGKVAISGVSGSIDQQFVGNDVFATVIWKAKKTGSTNIDFEFEQDSTTDSNIAVTFGNGDILSSVNSFKASIVVGAPGTATAEPVATATTSGNKSFLDNVFGSISRLLGKSPEGEIDPYSPISQKDPKTILTQDSNNVSFTSERPGMPATFIVGLVLAILVTILGAVMFIKSRPI